MTSAVYHPGETCTELSIAQYYYWRNLRKTMNKDCSKYKGCQFLKRNKKKYGKSPPKEAESKPWDLMCVYLIGQYQFTLKGGGKKYQMITTNRKSAYLLTVNTIDPATGVILLRPAKV